MNDTLLYQRIHSYFKYYLPAWATLLQWVPMARRDPKDHQGTLNVRGIPKDLVFKLKMAAAAERRSVKGFLLALVEERIAELERKGLLPKGK